MDIILGGGVVALFARDILGPQWKMVPVGRSLYYSFTPPLINNYIIRDDVTDRYLENHKLVPECVKNVISMKGHLTSDVLMLDDWLAKKYGTNVPPHAKAYWENHMQYFVYPGLSKLYREMQLKYKDDISTGNELGQIKSIDVNSHIIYFNDGGGVEYNYLLNTLPLDAFFKLSNIQYDLVSRDMWCYCVRSEAIDLEGATTALIADESIEFYEATKIGNIDYIFYSTQEVEQPAVVFMAMLQKFDLINETMVPNAIACGRPPQMDDLGISSVINVGSGAWDDCLDVGSCIKRLHKMQKHG